MDLLTGKIRAYPWGSRTAIATLAGREAPTASPEAELWFGAHPGDPALVGDEPLTDIIARDPRGQLGEAVEKTYGPTLPYLMKILAADTPLSLQAHPSKKQAESGFVAENERGVDVFSPSRNYRDDNHKPELIVALTKFTALAGFQRIEDVRKLLSILAIDELRHYMLMLSGDDTVASDALRALFTTWITIPAQDRAPLVGAVARRANQIIDEPGTIDPAIVSHLTTISLLAKTYPNDSGVLCALLLNHVELSPGEGLYLGAGQLHAYVHGTGVEVMANSDNVLRGGLTTKHVDVPELVKVVDFQPLVNLRVDKTVDQGKTIYHTPAKEFVVTTLTVSSASPSVVEHTGPTIALCTAGQLTARTADDRCITLRPCQAVWIPACDPAVTVTGDGQMFVVAPKSS